MEDRVPGNAGRPGGRFGNLETTASSDELEFSMSNIWRTIKPSVHQVRLLTKERNGGIRLARKINLKRRNPVWPSSYVTSAGASTDLAVGVRRTATHTKYTRRYDIINGLEIRWV